jgi:hypothetical protein
VEGRRRDNTYNVTYRVDEGATSSAGAVTAPVPSTVRITVSKSGASKVYTVTLVKGTQPGGTLWEEIESVSAKDDSQPAVGLDVTEVTLVVKSAYTGLIQSITVKGETARKQTGTPETWVARVEGKFTADQLVFNDVVVTRFPTAGGLPEEIESVSTRDDSQPAVGLDVTEVTLVVKSAYTGLIQSITVKGEAARKQTGSPETWVVRIEGKFTPADFSSANITVTRTGGNNKTPVEIAGNWPTPITRITKQDDSQPAVGVEVTVVRVYADPGAGSLTSVTVKGKAATPGAGNVWSVSFEANVNSFSLTASEVQVNYTTAPTTPGVTDVITYFNVGYSSMESAYVASIDVARSQGDNIQSIVITDDASGAPLASFPGAIEQLDAHYRFQGIVETVADRAAAAALNGKAVTATVTLKSGGEPDTAKDKYAFEDDED